MPWSQLLVESLRRALQSLLGDFTLMFAVIVYFGPVGILPVGGTI